MTTVLPTEPANWRLLGLCRNVEPELFFPLPTTPADVLEEVLAICNACPVVDTCRRWAYDNHIEFGVWGAETQQQRRTRLDHRERPTPAMSYQARVNAVRRLAADGHTDSAISSATGIPASTVTGIRRRYNIPAGIQTRRHRRELADAGLSSQAVARLTAGAS